METPNLVKKIRNIYGYSAKIFIAKKFMSPIVLLTIVSLIIFFACSDSENIYVYSVSALNEDGLEKVLGKSVEDFINNSYNCRFVAAEDTGTSYNIVPTKIEGKKNEQGVSFTQSSKKQADVPYGFYATCDKISSIGNMQNMRIPDLVYQAKLFKNVGILQSNLCDGITNYINSQNTSSFSGGSGLASYGSSASASSSNSTTNSSTTDNSANPYYNSKPTVTLTFSQDTDLKYILNATMDKASITPSNVDVAEYWLYSDASFTKGGVTNTVGFGEVASTGETTYVFENCDIKAFTTYYLVGRHKYKALNNVTYYSSWSDTKSIMPGRLAYTDNKLTVHVSDISANKIIYNFYRNNENIAYLNIPAISYITNTTATVGNLAVGGGLTPQNSPTFNATGGRRNGGFYTLDGSSQYIKSNIDLSGLSEFTVIWSYKGASGDTPHSLFRQQGQSEEDDYVVLFYAYEKGGGVTDTPYPDLSFGTNTANPPIWDSDKFTDDSWHEYAMTWKGGNPAAMLNIYTDGASMRSIQGSSATSVPNIAKKAAIGAYEDGFNSDGQPETREYTKGNVGYGVVMKKALSFDQIKEGYTNGYESVLGSANSPGAWLVNFENRFVKDYVSNQGVDLRDVAWVKKDNEGALYFNGYDNYIAITGSAPSVSDDFTLLLWIYPLEYPASSGDTFKEICNWYNTSNSNQAELRFSYVDSSSAKLEFILPNLTLSLSGVKVDNNWQMVGVKKSGNTYTLRLGGNSAAGSNSDSLSTNGIQIGRNSKDTTLKNTHYSGYMKNILYFKKALSDDQIESIRTNNGLKEILSNDLSSGEKWNVKLTPITNNVDGTGITSNTVILP